MNQIMNQTYGVTSEINSGQTLTLCAPKPPGVVFQGVSVPTSILLSKVYAILLLFF